MSAGERRARMILTGVGEPGHPALLGAVAGFGAEAVVDRLRSGGTELAGALASRLARFDLDREQNLAERVGARYLVPGDPEWPERLGDLVESPVLHERGGMPIGLWVRGPAGLADAVDRSVAVVGSRSCTTYGSELAAALAADVGAAGFTVVSGAAIGIDAWAHRGALAGRGRTVAVLACGVNRVYPRANEELIQRIGAEGLIVSEAPMSAAPMQIRFLARNRIIAALTQGTVVVEAAIRSGALNTANWAEGINRTVMGLPGSVCSEASAGVHELIRSRGALLVTRGAEVVEALAPMGEATLPVLRGPERPRDRLSTEQRQVLDAVPATRPAGLASIAHTAGLSPATVAEALDALVHVELVSAGPTGWQLSRLAAS